MNVTMEKKEAGHQTVFFNRYRLALGGLGLVSFSLLVALIVVASTGSDEPIVTGGVSQQDEVVCENDSCIAYANMLKQNMDTTVDPCVDFYDYVCMGYVDQPLRSDEVRRVVLIDVDKKNKEIIEAALSADRVDGEGEATAKAKEFYQSCMNIDAIEAAGAQPLKELLADLDLGFDQAPNVATEQQLAYFIANFTVTFSMNPFFVPFPQPKVSDPDKLRLGVYLPQLTLGAREYYLNKDPATDEALVALRDYIVRTTRAISPTTSLTNAEDLATRIIALETRLAEIFPPTNILTNTSATNNLVAYGELASTAPGIDWEAFFDTFLESNPEGLKAVKADGVNIQWPPYLQQMAQLIVEIDRDEVVDLMRWFMVHNLVKDLSSEFQLIRLDYDKVTAGVSEAPERSKACFNTVRKSMKFSVGKIFSDETFSEDSRVVAEEMIEYIRSAFKTRIDALSWMDAATKEKAKEKADMVTTKIGYPANLSTDEQLAEFYKMFKTSSSYMRNVEQNFRALSRRNILWLGKPVDKTTWARSPADVNAYYYPPANEIVFPAAILQQPMFDPSYPNILNFGGVGYIIGHELLHGFDSKGSTYDGTGRLVDWWTSASKEQFNERSQCLVDQYAEFSVGDMNVDGLLTLTENIADNGGLAVAYDAYKKFEKENVFPKQRLPGFKGTFSGDQLFFMNSASVWCSNVRPETAEGMLRTDNHSPGRFRVNGVVANLPAFSEVFKCPAGTPMNPVKKCSMF